MHHTTIKDIDAQRTSKIPLPWQPLSLIIAKKPLSLTLKRFYLSYPQKGRQSGRIVLLGWGSRKKRNGSERLFRGN